MNPNGPTIALAFFVACGIAGGLVCVVLEQARRLRRQRSMVRRQAAVIRSLQVRVADRFPGGGGTAGPRRVHEVD